MHRLLVQEQNSSGVSAPTCWSFRWFQSTTVQTKGAFLNWSVLADGSGTRKHFKFFVADLSASAMLLETQTVKHLGCLLVLCGFMKL